MVGIDGITVDANGDTVGFDKDSLMEYTLHHLIRPS